METTRGCRESFTASLMCFKSVGGGEGGGGGGVPAEAAESDGED